MIENGLKNSMVSVLQMEEMKNYAKQLLKIMIDEVAESDILQIGIGAFSPLIGFLTEKDYHSVVNQMHLANGEPWPIPVVLPIQECLEKSLILGDDVALVRQDDEVVAILNVQSIYRPNLRYEAEMVYKTTDPDHPGVKRLLSRGVVYVGGSVRVFTDHREDVFSPYFYTPQQTREWFASLGWKTVVGFQTRNPIHRAHEYIQKSALEIVDGLFLNPLVGPTKSDDVPAVVRLHAYQTILKHYYPENRVFFGVYKAAMRYAGPREAIMHALVRRNYGCTHFIVGRDHAGVGNYYGPYDAQKIFGQRLPLTLCLEVGACH